MNFYLSTVPTGRGRTYDPTRSSLRGQKSVMPRPGKFGNRLVAPIASAFRDVAPGQAMVTTGT
ncbi:hypothetical protein GFS60_06862 (plasmid) [Rhodococcus sp. WAY2]|nr:hypothetical protein GFS60_06862 [Rhodococcus sp. WAY2]